MKIRIGAFLIVLWMVATLAVYASQEREIERLRRDLHESRQEVANKTNRLYEANYELEMRKGPCEENSLRISTEKN